MRMNEIEMERLGDGVPFQRIRRITGYLTGTVDTWNNAKKAELADRVQHGLEVRNNGNMERN